MAGSSNAVWSNVRFEAGLVLTGTQVSAEVVWRGDFATGTTEHGEGTGRYFGWSVFVPRKLTDDSHAVAYLETGGRWRQLLVFHISGADIEFTTRVP